MKSREQIIAENPIIPYCESKGIILKGGGVERMARCPFHEDGTASFNVNVQSGLWTCHAKCGGGSIIDLMARFEGISPKAIFKRLAEVPEGWKPPRSAIKTQKTASDGATGQPDGKEPAPGKSQERPKLVKTYDYRNAQGELVYQACRLEPKSFRQRRPNPDFDAELGNNQDNPKWLWNMDGVERVLYNLPKILKSTGKIVVCEGERDCDTVSEIGFVSTTNVGGAGKWMESYAESFMGREVILCGDNDKPGREHMEKVLESLAGKAKRVWVVKVPEPFKDVTEWLESTKLNSVTGATELEDRFNAFSKLVDASPVYDKGLNIPIQSMAEIEREYVQSIQRVETNSLDFTKWLPTLGNVVRPLVPGELMTILAGPGVGKTALAQNMIIHAAPMKVLLFEQELPGSLTFERFAANVTGTESKEVFKHYVKGEQSKVAWRETGNLDHVFVCTRTKMTVEKIEELIIQSELKIGERPALVVVDYIQLMGGKGERYERVTDAAEGLKQIAKSTGTIIVMLSQISRKSKDGGQGSEEVMLSDGKESGGIENSSGVVLGAWKKSSDDPILWLRVLKNTKGLPGKKIACNFDGARMIITEAAPEHDGPTEKDVPKGKRIPEGRSVHND